MLLTVLLSLAARAGLPQALSRRYGPALLRAAVASLIMPSIVVSLGIGLMFRLLDTGVKAVARGAGHRRFAEATPLTLGMYTSGLGAHLTWTLPFGLLIMFAVFNRFDGRLRGGRARPRRHALADLPHVVLPLIGPSLVGMGMFGFTLSWDEIARSSQAMGDLNTLPLELQGLTTTVTTPEIYALGTVTTVVSFLVMGVTLATVWWWQRRGRG
jgi:putative spermidine/putrescine transport system permease protein